MHFYACIYLVNMHKNAFPHDESDPGPSCRSDINSDNSKPADLSPALRDGLNRRDFIRRSGLVLAGAAAASTFVGPRRVYAAGPVELTFASAKFFGKETIAEVVKSFNGSQSKIHVTYKELPPPSSSTEVHQSLVQQLARRNGDPDVFTLDIIWIAEFAAAKWAAQLDQYFKDSTSEYFPGMVQGCTWQNKLVALPWFVDSGMLYYRKDLVTSAPATWDDLIASAKEATGSGKAKFGFLWQAKQAEVLVCDLVSFIGSNGGSILEPDGKTVSIADEPAVQAVQLMYDLINKQKITPADVLSWDEEPSRRPFTGGEAAFLRNWSYVWKIAQSEAESKVVGQVAVVPLPHFSDKKSAACLGGYQYGINASSKKREAAVEFARWMSSPETQLRFATQLGLCPTRGAVFEQPEIGTEQPFMQQLKDVFLGAIPRPVTPKYPQVTLALQSAVSTALTNGKVEEALKAAKQKIEGIVKA
jgi:multiple sugar transport system substrate-binding protein